MQEECDHDYEWDTAAEGWFCKHCDEEAPADYGIETADEYWDEVNGK